MHGDHGAGVPVDPVVLVAGGQRLGEILQRHRHPVRGVPQRALGGLSPAAGRADERVEDLGNARGQHPSDGLGRVRGRLACTGQRGGQVLAGTGRVGPAGRFWPRRDGRDRDERAKVGPGVLAELCGLLEKLPDRFGERLPLAA